MFDRKDVIYDVQFNIGVDGLKTITYMDGLGSVYDKVLREEKIGLFKKRERTNRTFR